MATTEKNRLPGEQVLKTSDSGTLELTSYRVVFDAAASGRSRHVSIPLDAVSSCGLVTRSRPALLIAAGLCALIAFAQPAPGARWLLLAVAAILVLAYFATRSAVITVSSDGGQDIVVPAAGMKRDQIIPFLDAVMETRLRFMGRLQPAGSAQTGSDAVAGIRAAAHAERTGS